MINIKGLHWFFRFRIIFKLVIVFLSVLLFSCAKPVNKESNEISNPVVAYASVDKVEATIGDIITFNLNIDYAQGIKIQSPELKKYLSDFEISSSKQEKPKLIDNRLVETFVFKLQVKEVGSFIINPIEIKYAVPDNLAKKFGKNGSVKTSKIFIEIKTVLKPEDKDKDIEDIKPIEQITYINPLIIAALIAGIIILIIGLYLIRKKLLKPEKALLPHEQAFKELNELKMAKLLEKEEFKKFYFGLSETLRRYLKNRYGIMALEKTSNEVIDEIKTIHEISNDKKSFLKSFLETSDFYKFTDAISSTGEAEKLFDETYNFVRETLQIPEPVEKKR
jgi:hypothetical protein